MYSLSPYRLFMTALFDVATALILPREISITIEKEKYKKKHLVYTFKLYLYILIFDLFKL